MFSWGNQDMIVVQDRRDVDGKVVTWYSRYYLCSYSSISGGERGVREGGWGPLEIDIFIFLA